MTPPDPGHPTAAPNLETRRAFDNLAAALRAPVPDSLAALSADQLDDLTALTAQAKQQLLEELSYAALDALDNVPGFLRGVVRKAVGQ